MMRIDLISDTVTRPTAGMREAMFSAEIGDDVFKEDPSVNALEQYGAEMFGKEAALFCPSGTMTNQIAITLHTRPGDEVICDASAHVFTTETGGMAKNSGVQPKPLPGDFGRLKAEQIEEHINPSLDWLPKTSLVCLENTVNKAGGCFYALEDMQAISAICKNRNLPLHLDGARVFNALVATQDDPKEYGKCFDTLSVCLSKGLGAPIGSLLLGTKEKMAQARRIRKSMGGGMRQAGFLASAGLYALKHHVSRLSEDHHRAATIGAHLQNLPELRFLFPVATNIVLYQLQDTVPLDQYIARLAEAGVRVAPFGKQTVRMVTHLDFTDAHLDELLPILTRISETFH